MSRDRALVVIAALLSSVGNASCGGEPADETCRTGQAPEMGLRVTGGTDAYFYAHDINGRQIGFEVLNRVLTLEPGEYFAVLNATRRRVSIRSGSLTTCTAGDVRVIGTTDEYYYVLDTLGTQLAFQTMGRFLSLLPGTYTARLNNTTSRLTVGAGDTTELASGTAVVEGSTDEYYYVLDTVRTQLAFNTLGRPLGFFPGTYTVKVNNTTTRAEVRAGTAATVRSGTLVARGTTDQYFYVLDTAGTQLGFQQLGRAMAYLPGRYGLRVTSMDTAVSVQAGESTQVATGTLVVTGQGSDYYYLDDPSGRQLHFATLGTPTALLGGRYSVRVGRRTATASVTPGQTTTTARP
jgi:hypothetical protein